MKKTYLENVLVHFFLFDALLPQESEIEKEIVALGRSFTGSKSKGSK